MSEWTNFETKGIRGDGVFRNFVFQWKVHEQELKDKIPGVTPIDWQLYGLGGGGVVSEFELRLNDELVLRKWDEVVQFDKRIIGSGTKNIYHDANGNASLNFNIYISQIYTEVSTPVNQSTSWALVNNKPYSACYWGTNASVKINTTIQKPEANITISWTGANAGTANPIKNYRVEYSIDSGANWTLISESAPTTSAILKVPGNRGSTIIARVKINSSISSSYDSNYLQGGSCLINRVPGAPTVVPSATSLPSTQATISFNVTKGNDPDGQNCSIRYTKGTDPTYYDYTSGSGISISSGTTTYNFYTYDGLEYSSASSKTIYKNSKPLVEFSISGSTFNQTLEITKQDKGYTNNTYSFGYRYNNTDYLFSQKQSATSYTLGDIRAYLSDKLGGLDQSTTYSYKYWVQRHDGIEDSDRVYSGQSFSTPSLEVAAVSTSNTDIDGYFGTDISFLIGGESSYTNYHPLGKRTFSDTDIPRGGQISDLTLRRDSSSSQYFKLKLNTSQKLTKVYKFDFSNLSIPSSFKPYSTAKLTFSMAARDAAYGFSKQPTISYLLSSSSKNINSETASSNNTWNYSFDPDHLWKTNGLATSVVNNSTAKKTVTLSVTNEFGETFTKNCTLNFDFREVPMLEDFSISILNDNNTAIPLSKFQYIKEGVKIALYCKVKSYNGKFTYKLNLSGEECYNETHGKVDSYNTEPWIKNSTGGWTQSPYSVEVSKSSYSLSSKSSSSTGIFTFTVTTASGFVTDSRYSIPIKRHTSPQIHFKDLKFDASSTAGSGTITGSFKIDDNGYDGEDGTIEKVYTDYQGERKTIWESGDGQYTFSLSVKDFVVSYYSIAPYCESKLSAKYKDSGVTYGIASTTKTTDAPVFSVVYNVLPTVAYRQNFLGINTNNPKKNGTTTLSDVALTLSGYNNNQKVYLVSGNQIASIDLRTGAIDNFVIDGGTW